MMDYYKKNKKILKIILINFHTKKKDFSDIQTAALAYLHVEHNKDFSFKDYAHISDIF
ncbi:MAG: hypothetical protein ABI045_05315 [Flavobacteriales bacterium]